MLTKSRARRDEKYVVGNVSEQPLSLALLLTPRSEVRGRDGCPATKFLGSQVMVVTGGTASSPGPKTHFF